MEKSWKKDIARDAMALGSILFYFIAIIRSTIGSYHLFTYQLLIAFGILIILSFIIKNANHHIARAVPLGVFVSLFYKDNLFTIFAALIFVIMIISAFYIKERKESIVKGIVLGVFASVVGYYAVSYLI